MHRSSPAAATPSSRTSVRRPSIHPREKQLLAVLALHLCFLPWALGSMQAWNQLTSLGLAAAGFGLALLARPEESESAMARLVRFPIFWLGGALLVYIALQGFNPAWRFERNATTWWLVRLEPIAWLPSGIAAPFEHFNTWRQLIIYASAWLTVCSLWVGLTRRRSLQLLVTVLAVNAVALALVGVAQKINDTPMILGFVERPGASFFSSFVNKNHAGAYFALTTLMTAAIAAWWADHGNRTLRKSTPAGLFGLGALFLAFTVLFTLSRGATLAMALSAIGFVTWYFLRRRRLAALDTSPGVTLLIALVMAALVLNAARHLDYSRVLGGFDLVLEQQSEEDSLRSRFLAYDAARTMLAENGLRGVGAGSFRHLFPTYVRAHPAIYQEGRLFWEHAHNDWIQIPIELGLVGCLILVAGVAYGISVFLGQRALWHSLAVPMLLGCGQTLVHAWFDFPLQCPAILITWCALFAIAGRWVGIEGGCLR